MALFFEPLTDVITILSVILVLLYYYLTSTFSFWEKLNVPYLKPEIFFGNMKDIVLFRKSQPEKFLEFHKHFRKSGNCYGGIFQLRQPVLLICTPDLIKDVLIKNFPSFHDRGMSYDEHFDPLTAHLILLEGQRWKYIRSKLAPAFSTGKLNTMISSFIEASSPLLQLWEKACSNDEALDIRELMAQYTTDVIGMCAFGLQFNALGGKSTFRDMGRKLMEPSMKEKIFQIVRNVYPWIYKTFKLRMVSKDMTEYFINVLRETMQERKRSNIEKNDFLNYLIKIRDQKGMDLNLMEEMKGVKDYNTSVDDNAIELTDGVIAAQAFIFFLAGFETTSTTLSFCLYELAANPNIQKRLQEEIDDQIRNHKNINIDFLHDLVYMEQVIQETLRKYPAAPLLMRTCTKLYQIPNSKTVIPEGTQIFIAPYSIHHDPEYYPEPEKFDPERFAPKNKENIIPYTYIPFGEGPRICIGKRFAMLEMKTALTELLSKFTVVKCDKTKPVRISPKAFILTPVDGIWLKVVKRTNI